MTRTGTSSLNLAPEALSSISVALCTYNGERYLPAQLASLAAQTRLPFELVVCDDCSSDRTPEILKAFARNAPFPVRWYINENNLGCTGNFEKAIHLCQGSLIALCDQDDVWERSKLAQLGAVLDSQPATGAVFSNASLMDAYAAPVSGALWDNVGFSREDQRRFDADPTFFLIKRPLVTGATLVFRASLVGHILPISPEWVHDEWIALVISAIARLQFVNERLIRYRLHANQQIGVRRHGLSFALATRQKERSAFQRRTARKLAAIADKLTHYPNAAASETFAREKARYLERRAELLACGNLSRAVRGLPVLAQHRIYGSGFVSYLLDSLSL